LKSVLRLIGSIFRLDGCGKSCCDGQNAGLGVELENPKSTATVMNWREEQLAVYILLSKLTAEGRKTVREKPGRIQEVNREIEKLGVKVLAQYATLGPYDFVNVVDAPDNKTIVKVSVELGARGTIEITTLPTLPLDEFVSTVKGK